MRQDCTTCLFRAICEDDAEFTWHCADHGYWNWTAADENWTATGEPRREDCTGTPGEADA